MLSTLFLALSYSTRFLSTVSLTLVAKRNGGTNAKITNDADQNPEAMLEEKLFVDFDRHGEPLGGSN